jgi:O-antigen/teichoic acid export membrane protein
MFYYEKTWEMSLITIICAVVNIVTNYFGIKYIGYLAAGYTTLGCSMLQMLLCYFIVRKYEKNLKQIVDLRWFFLIIVSYLVVMGYSIIFHDIFWARLGLLVAVLLAVLILHKKIIKMFMSMKDKNKASKQGGQKGELTADSLDEMEIVDGQGEIAALSEESP